MKQKFYRENQKLPLIERKLYFHRFNEETRFFERIGVNYSTVNIIIIVLLLIILIVIMNF